MDEAAALLTTLEATTPETPTACSGWTAHHLVAHLAAGAAEMADLIEGSIAGGAERATRTFGDREAPYVALVDTELRASLFTQAIRLNVAIDQLKEMEPPRMVAFSGRRLTPSELALHGRSEAAIHRWDLAGDDEIGSDLLAAPELTTHAVSVLNTMLTGSHEAVASRVLAAGLGPLRVHFAAPGSDDVMLIVNENGARLEMDEPSRDPTVWGEQATRLLALWGRRSPGATFKWGEDELASTSLSSFLWGV